MGFIQLRTGSPVKKQNDPFGTGKEMIDEWTPLFEQLEERVSIQGRRRLLFQLIGELHDISVFNFGKDGQNRPVEWPSLTKLYAYLAHDGDQIPTLILSGAMKDSFVHEILNDSATLTNVADYASEHQLGTSKIPARPFFPIDSNGQLIPFAATRLMEILDSHFEVSL